MDNITDPSEHPVHAAQAQLQHPSQHPAPSPQGSHHMFHTMWRPLAVQRRVRALEAHDSSWSKGLREYHFLKVTYHHLEVALPNLNMQDHTDLQ